MQPSEVCSHCSKAVTGNEPSGVCKACAQAAAVTDAATIPPARINIADSATLPPDTNAADSATLPPSNPGELQHPSSGSKLASGTTFGDYELDGEIARGGMGVVYRAQQTKLNRNVALKMILAGRLASESDVQRFLIEAEAAAQLEHPGIVPIYDIGDVDGQHYFSMPLIEGQSLAERIQSGPLPAEEATRYVQLVAEAVHYAHERGIVHRDLKPANILLDKDGTPKVTDFGLAKHIGEETGMTATGQVMGTAGYMPPEQASGKSDEIDRRSDVYSIGAILYCLLTGRPPFQAATQMETLLMLLEHDPIPPQQLNPTISNDLQTITLKCLQKKSTRRYDTAQELADELQRVLEDRPIIARPVSAIERTWRWCQRNRTIAALLASLTLSIIIGIIGVSIQWQRAESALGLASVKVVELTEAEDELEKELYSSNLLRGDALKLAGRYTEAEDLYWRLLENPIVNDDRRAWWRLWKFFWEHPRDGVLPVSGGEPIVNESAGLIATIDDNRVHLVDFSTREAQLELTSPNGEIAAATMSPDGSWLVTSHTNGPSLTLWNLREPSAPRSLSSKAGLEATPTERTMLASTAGPQYIEMFEDALMSRSYLHFFANNQFAQFDWNGIHIWSIDGEERIIEGTRAGLMIQQQDLMGISAGGAKAWTYRAFGGGTITQFEIADGKATQTTVGSEQDTLRFYTEDSPNAFKLILGTISHDGQRLAVIENEPLRISVWDLDTSKLLTRRELNGEAPAAGSRLAFSHNAQQLGLTENDKITIFDSQTLETTSEISELPERSRFSGLIRNRAGKPECLITEQRSRVRKTETMRVGLRPLESGRAIAKAQSNVIGTVWLGPNSVSYGLGLSKLTMQSSLVRTTPDAEPISIPLQVRAFGSMVVSSEDGSTIATVDQNQTLFVFDGTTLETIAERKLDTPPGQISLAISPDGSRIAFATPDCVLHLCDSKTLEDDKEIEVPSVLTSRLRFSSTGTWLTFLSIELDKKAATSNGPMRRKLELLDSTSGTVAGTYFFDKTEPAIQFSQEDDLLYVGTDEISIFSVPTLSPQTTWQTSVTGFTVIHPESDSRTLFCGTIDGSIVVFDTKLLHENVVLKVANSAINQLRFDSGRQTLRFVAAGSEQEIELGPATDRILMHQKHRPDNEATEPAEDAASPAPTTD